MLRRLGALFAALFLVTLGVQVAALPGDDAAPGVGAKAAAADPAAFSRPPPGPSLAPAPVRRGPLLALAEQLGDRVALHTASGDVTFWTGVNLGSTTPGHQPGEFAVEREDYRRWFGQMSDLGVRVLRIYTIHPPVMYEELRAHNEAHPDAPLYLAHGVYLPDETYVQTGDLFAPGPTAAFTAELRAASAAAHGTLQRPDTPGRASGQWTADVSPWLVSWIIGIEFEPHAVLASDRRNAAAPEFSGAYFRSTGDATPSSPTERWLAARMDELATAEAERGTSAPIAFINWPTTDPLAHPQEASTGEDLVGLDADHVRATAAWPGGTFASYHAYPYFPDFLRHDPDYQAYRLDGRKDPYAAYLNALDADSELPLMVTELGVPSSLGSSHNGTEGRHQGDHSEQQALATNASLVRLADRLDLAGALVFAWNDEWFKPSWNTEPRQAVSDVGRRSLWHDPLSNEQFFGLLASDPVPVGRRVLAESATGVREVSLDHDASYVHLTVTLDAEPVEPVRLGFDVTPSRDGGPLPGGGGEPVHEVAVVVDPAARTATASIRSGQDPVRLDGQPAGALPGVPSDGWALQRLSVNRPDVVAGVERPAEYQEVGRLREGEWDPSSPQVDSRSTWRLDGTVLRLRLPWSMLGIGDPSDQLALELVDGQVRPTRVLAVGLVVDAGPGGRAEGMIRWEGWQEARYTERIKAGAQPLVDAWAELGGPG